MSASRHVGGSLDSNLPKAKDVASIKRNEANRLCFSSYSPAFQLPFRSPEGPVVSDSFDGIRARVWGLDAKSTSSCFHRLFLRSLHVTSTFKSHSSCHTITTQHPSSCSIIASPAALNADLLHTDRYVRYQRLAYKHVYADHSIAAAFPIPDKVYFRN